MLAHMMPIFISMNLLKLSFESRYVKMKLTMRTLFVNPKISDVDQD